LDENIKMKGFLSLMEDDLPFGTIFYMRLRKQGIELRMIEGSKQLSFLQPFRRDHFSPPEISNVKVQISNEIQSSNNKVSAAGYTI
jgi:hypothetical protein